jgi:hypothetical protein
MLQSVVDKGHSFAECQEILRQSESQRIVRFVRCEDRVGALSLECIR